MNDLSAILVKAEEAQDHEANLHALADMFNSHAWRCRDEEQAQELHDAANHIDTMTADVIAMIGEIERLRRELAEDDDLGAIRALGWAVAVHNDYYLDGEAHTFWLFTKNGQAVKGEGRTDKEALDQVRSILEHDESAADRWRERCVNESAEWQIANAEIQSKVDRAVAMLKRWPQGRPAYFPDGRGQVCSVSDKEREEVHKLIAELESDAAQLNEKNESVLSAESLEEFCKRTDKDPEKLRRNIGALDDDLRTVAREQLEGDEDPRSVTDQVTDMLNGKVHFSTRYAYHAVASSMKSAGISGAAIVGLLERIRASEQDELREVLGLLQTKLEQMDD